jgi:hypothetical protein
MSIDLQTALSKDMAVTYWDGSVEYVDNSADFTQGMVEDPNIVDVSDGPGQVSLNDL